MKTPNLTRATALIALLAAGLLAGCGPSTPEEFVAAARKELVKNDRQAAIIHLRNALQKNPELGEARFLLGQALLDKGEAVAAEKELRKAVALDYAPEKSVPTLARSMLVAGQARKLIDEFMGTRFESAGATADLATTIGFARLAVGEPGAAQAAFEVALAAEPDYPRAILGMARIAAGKGDLKAALDLLDKALAKAPGLSEGWQLKGAIHNTQKQADEALAAYRKAIETEDNNLPAHAAIIGILITQGKLDQATAQLEAVKKFAPGNPQTLYLQAWIAFAQKNYSAANEVILRQLKGAPDNIPGLLLAGAIDLALKSYGQAETKLSKVLAVLPRNRLALRLLVSTYIESGQNAKAQEIVRRIMPAIGNDADLLALAGTTFMQAGDVDEGIQLFEKAAELDPKSTGKRTALGLAHLAKGHPEQAAEELEQAAAVDAGTSADMALIAMHLRQRQMDKALAAIDVLEKKQPQSPGPWNLRGIALSGKNDIAGARRSFERALEIDPAHFPAAANLARLDLAEKKPDQAKKRFESVLAKDPKSAKAYLALAGLRAGSGGSKDEVGAMMAKAVAANPTDEDARLALIDHYLRNKDGAKAVVAAQEALAAMPNRPRILEALGRSHRAAGDNNQAISAYLKLAEVEPGSPVPHVRMAELHVAAGAKDKALQSLKLALARKPDMVEAQRAVIALDLNAGRLKQAIAMAREVQHQRPKQSIGYIFEGDIYASKKAWNEAAAAYRTGLKAVDSADLAVKLDTVLRNSGNQSEADKFASAWVKDHPKDVAFRLYLAQSALAKKDYAKAAAQFGAVAEARPNDGLVLNNYAWTLGQAKDPRALEYAEKANKLSPNNPVVMDTLGVLLVEKGETKRGVELLRKASELAPKSVAIRLNLAKALLKDGEKSAAKKELETLEKLGDKNPSRAEVAQLMKGL